MDGFRILWHYTKTSNEMRRIFIYKINIFIVESKVKVYSLIRTREKNVLEFYSMLLTINKERQCYYFKETKK